MVSDMVRHQTIHLSNPDINYVRLENCKYCKIERMKEYDLRRRNNPFTNNSHVVNFYRYDTILYYYENPTFEDVQVETTLKRLNSSSSLKINKKEGFCPICQDTINKDIIVRKMNCGHTFHQECADKWLETSKICPVCRYEI